MSYRTFCWIAIALGIAALFSTFCWAAFDMRWWKPISHDDDREFVRFMVLFMFHCAAIFFGGVAAINFPEKP